MPDEDPHRSIYDARTPEEDLWFVPAPPDEGAPFAPPLPHAQHPELPAASAWQAAEAGQGRALAEAASALARLDERVATFAAGEGAYTAVRRLALLEAAALSWAEGQRISAERLALYAVLRLSAADEDQRDLALADWARTRLAGRHDPHDMARFLGRHPAGASRHAEADHAIGLRPVGEEFRALAARWSDALEAGDLHPLTRAGFAYHLWRAQGLSGFEAVIEPAVVAARLGGGDNRALPFVPLALAGVQGLMAGGPPAQRLALWYRAITSAAQAARLHLERLASWQARATEAIADLSGKTPRALIHALLTTPVLSAEATEALTGASRAAVQRNLALFTTRGLAREITGQSRYRFWKATT